MTLDNALKAAGPQRPPRCPWASAWYDVHGIPTGDLSRHRVWHHVDAVHKATQDAFKTEVWDR